MVSLSFSPYLFSLQPTLILTLPFLHYSYKHRCLHSKLTPAGALIISTPHTLALKDAQKGISTFEKLNVPILGLVQNMSLYTCPHCSTPSHVFGSASRTRTLCDNADIEFLGDVPLDPAVVEKEVDGQVRPALVAEPGGKGAGVFMEFAKKVAGKIGLV